MSDDVSEIGDASPGDLGVPGLQLRGQVGAGLPDRLQAPDNRVTNRALLSELLGAICCVFADALNALSHPGQVISLPLRMGGVHNGTAPSMILWTRS